MRKTHLAMTIVLLWSIWIVAQSTGKQAGSPNGTPPSPQQGAAPQQAANQQPAAPVATQTQAGLPLAPTAHDSLLEGCLGGSSGHFTLTDTAGKVYPLRGDTAQFAEHVGQQVSVTGTEESESTSAGGAQSTFNVKKVKFIGRACETTSK